MVIRFIGRRPEMERYMAVYHKGEENVIRFQMPIPYNNGRKYRLYLGETDVTDGFDYSNASYIHMPVTVKRGGMTIWTSEPLWVDVVREEEDKLSEGNVPSTDQPNMYLGTDANGEKKWEEKTHGPVGTIERGRCTWNTAEEEYPPYEFQVIVGWDADRSYRPTAAHITIIWDGVEYPNLTFDEEVWGYGGGDMPFKFELWGNEGYGLTWEDEDAHEVTCIGFDVDNRTLDPKYLPDALRKPVVFKDYGYTDGEGNAVVDCTTHTAAEVVEIMLKYQYKNRSSADFPLTPFLYETANSGTATNYRTAAVCCGVFGNEKIMFIKTEWQKGQTVGKFSIISITPNASTGYFYLEEYKTFLPDAMHYNGRPFLTKEDGGYLSWSETIIPILRSSTEGSTKKFKLTVDDSGTLTATEVTG